MSSLALMRWLEGSPQRYDAGMRLLTFGRVTPLHAAVVAAAARKPGDRVLEIGCGTGSVTARLVAAGARITALDQSPEMLEQARARLPEAGVTWLEQTAAEIDRMPEAGFDAVVLSLCLSDMSASERGFVLREAGRRLAAGGRVVVADEVRAPGLFGWLQRLWRVPQAALGWLLVGSVSRPVPDLVGELHAAGLVVRAEQRWLLGSLAAMVAEPER
ncbi:MAG: class I SAM-dependent methyltransferase [Deltaproteobacteria bacterium]|nr:class I SAM-dependent methyltransferase [Deltaproteobacteria bacterium]